MTASVHVRNRQRTAPIQARYLREIARAVLERTAPERPGSLGIYLVGRPEIVRLNETFLGHAGPTDVIAFDYREHSRKRTTRHALYAEVFICVEEAMSQARRYRAPWPEEVVRCMIHGVLHLTGHDDAQPSQRRKMKRVENRLVREMRKRFGWKRTALRFTTVPLR